MTDHDAADRIRTLRAENKALRVLVGKLQSLHRFATELRRQEREAANREAMLLGVIAELTAEVAVHRHAGELRGDERPLVGEA